MTDVISNGGNWSAFVTLFIGFVYLFVGVSVDRGPRNPYGFWWHFSAAFLIGGALVYWWHSSETDWALLATASVAYILLAGHTQRSIWAVLGIVGFFAAATHWTIEWVSTGLLSLGSDRSWVPLVVVAVVGFFFVLLGLFLDCADAGASPRRCRPPRRPYNRPWRSRSGSVSWPCRETSASTRRSCAALARSRSRCASPASSPGSTA